MPSLESYSPGAMALRFALVVTVVVTVAAAAAEAQDLPAYMPINPVATSRSGLYFQPYVDPSRGQWSVGVDVDYASTIEYNQQVTAEYILDSELLRFNLHLKRDVGTKNFVIAEAAVRGAYNGFLDGFFDWYHDVLGIRLKEREARPRDEFLYLMEPMGTAAFERRAGDLFLGDVHLAAGHRYSPAAQGVVSITLPTATGPAGYGRGVVSASVIHTVRTSAARRAMYEGSAGLGFTPTQGRLAPFQREVFASLSSGMRVRIWRRQALYANLFYHTPYYHDTALPALDRYELSLDFGWMMRTCGGTEWRVGLTEDPKPSGPGVDVVLRLGVAFRRGTVPCAGAEIPSRLSPGD